MKWLLLLIIFWIPNEYSAGQNSPPLIPIRQPAEFEPMQGVIIGYPFSLTLPIIKEMAEDTEVVTLCLNAAQEAIVIQKYKQNRVNLNNCSFIHHKIEVSCTRDYAPWFLIDGNGEQGIADFRFPWPGEPGNNGVPMAVGREYNIPVYYMGIASEGGNYMTDGLGISVSTVLVDEDNPNHTRHQIKQVVNDYLGVHTYHIVPHAIKTWLKHLDCWAKFLTPDTILIAEAPMGHPNHQGLEDARSYFENQISGYGTPYKIVRVNCPNAEPYTNALILNHKVLVPIMGTPGPDNAALDAYKAAMPGYQVHGFTGSWSSNGALHCQTMGITDRHMLYIKHTPLLDRPPEANGFPIQAEVIPYSGKSLINNTPEVLWKTSGKWNTVKMTNTGGDLYLAYLPSQPEGVTIQYYIHGEDASGRSEYHPYMGAPGAHSFRVTTLGSNASALTGRLGASIDFYLNAGPSNSGREYRLLCTASGTQPGLPLPGGLTLPLNWDAIMNLSLVLANSVFFTDFHGKLDKHGLAEAQLNTLGPLPRTLTGLQLDFAFLLCSPFDFVSNPVSVKIME